MTITLGAVFGPGRAFPATSQALSFGTVTAGQLVTFEVVYWNPVAVDVLTDDDVTQTAGTATITRPVVDRQDGIQADTSVWLRTAVYSCVVRTGGTLTLTLAGLQTGAAPTVFGATWNATQGWSEIPAFRLDGAGAGAATASNGLTSWASGSATSTATSDRNSVHIGVLAWNAGVNSNLTITGGLFSSIGVENDGTSFEPGAASYLIDTTATSADASWSGVMTGAATEGASATQVIYREGQGWNKSGTGPKVVANLSHPFGAGAVESFFRGVAAGSPPHPTNGALVASAATLAGTAAHFTLHATSGALAASAATLSGAADHRTLHATTGALTASAATLAGQAAHQNATNGALVASAASVAGTAAHLTLHTTSGALVSSAAVITGSAAHQRATTGALAASAATMTGDAARAAGGVLHVTDGALVASAASMTGAAAHLTLHTTSGALAAQAATITGAAAHQHATTGALVASSATLAGSAAHLTLHTTSGALVSGAAVISGAADHTAGGSHDTSGALAAQAAAIAGEAIRTASATAQAAGLGDWAIVARRRQAELDRQLERQRQAQRAAEEEVEQRERALVRARSEKAKERERQRLAKAQEQQAEQARLVELIAQELAALMQTGRTATLPVGTDPYQSEEEEALLLLLLA